MKIKVGNKIYDGEEEPVMVILAKQDKENIKNMIPGATKYCMYPETFSIEEIKIFMATTTDNLDGTYTIEEKEIIGEKNVINHKTSSKKTKSYKG